MRDDDGIPVAGGDAAEKLRAAVLRKVILARRKDGGVRVQGQQLGRELREHVIGHGKHGFAGQSETLHLNGGGNHRVGFARAHGVGQENVAAAHATPHGIFLVRTQRDLAAAGGQRQMSTIEDTEPNGIELVVIQAAEPFPAPVILPDPCLESFLDLLLLVACAFRFGRIDGGLSGVRVAVVNGGCFEV